MRYHLFLKSIGKMHMHKCIRNIRTLGRTELEDMEKANHWKVSHIMKVHQWMNSYKVKSLQYYGKTNVGSMWWHQRRHGGVLRRQNSLNGSDGCGWKILRNSALVTCQKEEIQWPGSSAEAAGVFKGGLWDNPWSDHLAALLVQRAQGLDGLR